MEDMDACKCVYRRVGMQAWTNRRDEACRRVCLHVGMEVLAKERPEVVVMDIEILIY